MLMSNRPDQGGSKTFWFCQNELYAFKCDTKFEPASEQCASRTTACARFMPGWGDTDPRVGQN
jgi:hypothetical protein